MEEEFENTKGRTDNTTANKKGQNNRLTMTNTTT
jgi:hypothetical protein